MIFFILTAIACVISAWTWLITTPRSWICLLDEWPWTLPMLKPSNGIDASLCAKENLPPDVILHDRGLFFWKQVRLWAKARDAHTKASLWATALLHQLKALENCISCLEDVLLSGCKDWLLCHLSTTLTFSVYGLKNGNQKWCLNVAFCGWAC